MIEKISYAFRIIGLIACACGFILLAVESIGIIKPDGFPTDQLIPTMIIVCGAVLVLISFGITAVDKKIRYNKTIP